MTTTRQQKAFAALVRRTVGMTGHRAPIEIVPGNQPPVVTGEGWHYRTRGGRRIKFPSAYSKRGFSNMVYWPSSLEIVVGWDWTPTAPAVVASEGGAQ